MQQEIKHQQKLNEHALIEIIILHYSINKCSAIKLASIIDNVIVDN